MNNKSYKFQLFLGLFFLVLGTNVVAEQSMGIDKHKALGINCAQCHEQGIYNYTANKSCTQCHPQDTLIEKTNHLNFYSEMKNAKTGEITKHLALVNPHNSFHFGKTEECTDCHKNHSVSKNDCDACHDTKAWGFKEPK